MSPLDAVRRAIVPTLQQARASSPAASTAADALAPVARFSMGQQREFAQAWNDPAQQVSNAQPLATAAAAPAQGLAVDPSTGEPAENIEALSANAPGPQTFSEAWTSANSEAAPVRTWTDPSVQAAAGDEYAAAWNDQPGTATPAKTPLESVEVPGYVKPEPVAPAATAAPATPPPMTREGWRAFLKGPKPRVDATAGALGQDEPRVTN